ncbi:MULTISPECIES: YqeG family HAD IIIA-type phosphatase [Francisella]|uniref:HAD family hydrolase n=1 Tax=Francisella opportunistica TaxID=2016517 RepID=A0A345JP82_9GAMM|nr:MULTISPECIES: HAD family hydrolase [Francisella]APC90787.1 Hydrolase, HAD subfamily IIIA [Francisella sp. MA067296]AXH29128.1 HAD family hydrolase [Francisella opportunistica]AXH30781.1 HAD family hydrolase [Francisella opportunistica]AXH32426.1 HAD family hydrolase [Francisella opportunistica]
MLQRGLYTLKQIFKYRKELYGLSRGYLIDSVIDLSAKLLKQQGINYLALDFDGVLASHGKPEMHPEVMFWLNNFVTEFPQERIFILSNKPTQARLEYFNTNFPKIRFIAGVAKKPYPDGLNKIIQLVNCQAKELALVDDRLLTGCLACLIAGCYPILVTKPYIDTDNYTKEEKFFKFLRYSEQKIFL